jgi:hypothetical protein
MRSLSSIAGAVLLAAALGLPSSAAAEVVHLVPEDKAAWSPGRLLGFLRPGHNYGERRIEVETMPSDAVLDLYYVRAGFQKRYEQAEAPATVMLPKRSEATGRDTVTIRASAEGFQAKQVTLRVQGSEERLLLELEPLANVLHNVEHTYFGGRGSVSFILKEAPQVRVQKGSGSFQIALHETARGEALEETFSQVRSPLVAALGAQQVGSDLMVRIAFAEDADAGTLDLRSRQSHDPIADEYRYSVDFVPADGGASAVAHAQQALRTVAPTDVLGCATAFDDGMRNALEPAQLARALSPRGAFTDPYLRAAMKRLGEVTPGGRIQMLDGSEYAPHNPLELSAAMIQASHARGYLALLRRFVALLEPAEQRRVALRSLVAPDLGVAAFDAAMDAAEAAEAACDRGQSTAPDASADGGRS